MTNCPRPAGSPRATSIFPADMASELPAGPVPVRRHSPLPAQQRMPSEIRYK